MPDDDAFRKGVLIVGAGPAGVALAMRLVDAGTPVMLVPGGANRETDEDRDRLRGDSPSGVWSHEELHLNRRAVVGGTSTAWGGRCVLLDQVDFEHRPWIPHSGWPIAYSEYRRWIPQAAELLEIPADSFARTVEDDLLTGTCPGRAIDFGISSEETEVWSRPTDFSGYVNSVLMASPLCRVLVDARVLALEVEDDAVTGVRIDGPQGPQTLEAATVVLAAGTLESTRLLLETPFADALPALGRYYMSHTFSTLMRFSGRPIAASSGFFRVGGAYVRNRWRLSDAEQAVRGVGNAIGFVARPPADPNAIHVDVLSAAVDLAKITVRAVRARSKALSVIRSERENLRRSARVLARADVSTWLRLTRQGLARAGGRRLPIVLPPLDATTHHLTFQGEHCPDPDSRVALGDQIDADGRRRLHVHIEFGRVDFETVRVFHERMAAVLTCRGYTVEDEPEDVQRRLAHQMYGAFNSNAHFLGTTRMSASAETGVVDAQLKVHGTQNLYVVGGGVFPTSGHANPTLTIVALSCRLAHHLAARHSTPANRGASPTGSKTADC